MAAGGVGGRKLELEKVHTSVNPADVCTKALPWERIRSLCALANVHLCLYEDTMGRDPSTWSIAAFTTAGP